MTHVVKINSNPCYYVPRARNYYLRSDHPIADFGHRPRKDGRTDDMVMTVSTSRGVPNVGILQADKFETITGTAAIFTFGESGEYCLIY